MTSTQSVRKASGQGLKRRNRRMTGILGVGTKITWAEVQREGSAETSTSTRG